MTGDVADQIVERVAALRTLASLSDAGRETLTLIARHGLPPREAGLVVGRLPGGVLGAAAPRAPPEAEADARALT